MNVLQQEQRSNSISPTTNNTKQPSLEPRDKKRCRLDSAEELSLQALLRVSTDLPECLPPLDAVERDRKAFFGPTDESNWVIHKHLLVGAYPASANEQVHQKTLKSILDQGVSTFVCLQAEYDHFSTNRNANMRNYMEDAYQICKRAEKEQDSNLCKASELTLLHLPISDCSVTNDATVEKLAKVICARLLRGEVVYMHCWGGHGRTGTLVATILGMLYHIPKAEALKRTQLYHDCRSYPLQVPSPQTFEQRMQVLRVLDAFYNQDDAQGLSWDALRSSIVHSHEFELPASNSMHMAVFPRESIKRARLSLVGGASMSMQKSIMKREVGQQQEKKECIGIDGGLLRSLVPPPRTPTQTPTRWSA